MSFINKIPRGLRVLTVMVVLAVLLWQIAWNTNYFYYSLGVAVLITFGTIAWVYKIFKFSGSRKQSTSQEKVEGSEKTAGTDASDVIEIEADYTDTPSIMRAKPNASFRQAAAKPEKVEAVHNNNQTTKISDTESWQVIKPVKPAEQDTIPVEKDLIPNSDPSATAPSIPLVDDVSTLTEEDKNQLVNAVWYRCENPFCKYTSFLGVHHIVDENAGGTNRLDNLIVLCPYCHDLAHHNEIPVEEMREWISNRENRFKFKPDWKYF
jgi:hypothetical protein